MPQRLFEQHKTALVYMHSLLYMCMCSAIANVAAGEICRKVYSLMMYASHMSPSFMNTLLLVYVLKELRI